MKALIAFAAVLLGTALFAGLLIPVEASQPLRVLGGVQPQIITPDPPTILHLRDIHGKDHYIPVGMVQGIQSAFQEDGQEYCRLIVDGSGWAPVITVRASAAHVAKIWASLTDQSVYQETIGESK